MEFSRASSASATAISRRSWSTTARATGRSSIFAATGLMSGSSPGRRTVASRPRSTRAFARPGASSSPWSTTTSSSTRMARRHGRGARAARSGRLDRLAAARVGAPQHARRGRRPGRLGRVLRASWPGGEGRRPVLRARTGGLGLRGSRPLPADGVRGRGPVRRELLRLRRGHRLGGSGAARGLAVLLRARRGRLPRRRRDQQPGRRLRAVPEPPQHGPDDDQELPAPGADHRRAMVGVAARDVVAQGGHAWRGAGPDARLARRGCGDPGDAAGTARGPEAPAKRLPASRSNPEARLPAPTPRRPLRRAPPADSASRHPCRRVAAGDPRQPAADPDRRIARSPARPRTPRDAPARRGRSRSRCGSPVGAAARGRLRSTSRP